MNTIKDLVALLQTIPADIPLPDVDTDVDGDLKFEWYFYKYNLVLLTVPTDGTAPYISKWVGAVGGTEYNLRQLPTLLQQAKNNKKPEV